MQTEYIEQWTSFGQTAFAAMKELGEINIKTMEKLSEQQLDLLNACLDTSVKQWELLGEVKGYKELLTGEAKLIASYNDKLMEAVGKTTAIASKSKDEWTAWFEKGLESTLVEPSKKPAAAAKKPAISN
jgi:phasin family protein